MCEQFLTHCYSPPVTCFDMISGPDIFVKTGFMTDPVVWSVAQAGVGLTVSERDNDAGQWWSAVEQCMVACWSGQCWLGHQALLSTLGLPCPR